jgi:glycosyltransferase involved in cell wall biosynthesis
MQLNSIFRQLENNDSLNILTFPTHERYQQGLGLTNHTFFMYRGKHIKDWETKYGKIPQNHILLPHGQIPNDIGFDIVLSQNKFGQFPIAEKISRHLNIPMISLEHTLPVPSWNRSTRTELHNMQGDLNVFISDFSRSEWGFTDLDNTKIIHHMVDTDVFVPRYESREIVFLSVVNDWIGRDWCCGFNMWKRIVELAKLPVKVLGDTPGLSKPASSIDELSDTYAKCKFFINTSTVSPIPTALLEAMSAGCICISTATCMIPEIIQDGYNGFISNDETELAGRCKELMENPDKYAYISDNARNTILKHFHKDTFVNNWNDAFRSVLCIK